MQMADPGRISDLIEVPTLRKGKADPQLSNVVTPHFAMSKHNQKFCSNAQSCVLWQDVFGFTFFFWKAISELVKFIGLGKLKGR